MHSTEPEAPCFLAGVETSASGRLFGVVALEGLEFQSGSVLETTESGFVDDAEATGINVVDAAADIVVATDLDFLGRVVSGVVLASPFVLEWCRTFDPCAAQSAFDDFAFLVALNATGGADVVFVVVDRALEDDVLVEKAIAIIQAFAVVDATGGFGYDLLATDAGAGEPEFANFERLADVVFFAFFDATVGHQTSSVVDGLVADHDEVVLDDFFVRLDSFALIDATGVDRVQIFAVAFAREEVGAVFPILVDFVFLTLIKTSGGVQRQQVSGGVQKASEAERFLVDRGVDIDFFQVVGHTTFRDNNTIAAFVEETTAFQRGAIG